MANHGGGFVVLGYDDDNGTLTPAEPRPENLNQYSQDLVNGYIHRYADPVFHCECREVINPENRLAYPIVLVPGGHTTPIRTRRGGPNGQYFLQNVYLIRRPGPRSEAPQSAQEWSDFLNRCIMNRKDELLESFRSILTGVPTQIIDDSVDAALDEWISESLDRFTELINEKLHDEIPSRYSYGTWFVSYMINGEFVVPDLPSFREIIRSIEGNETGWPAWINDISHGMLYPYEGLIECLILGGKFQEGAFSDFWRASPDGRAFLLRGHQEDVSNSRHEPRTVFDLTLPIWRIGECVLHSYRFAEALSDDPLEITFSVQWAGLANRTLTSYANPRYMMRGSDVCHTDTINSKITFSSDQINTNFPDIVNEILKPLYEAFNFFSLPRSTLMYELKRLRKQV